MIRTKIPQFRWGNFSPWYRRIQILLNCCFHMVWLQLRIWDKILEEQKQGKCLNQILIWRGKHKRRDWLMIRKRREERRELNIHKLIKWKKKKRRKRRSRVMRFLHKIGKETMINGRMLWKMELLVIGNQEKEM